MSITVDDTNPNVHYIVVDTSWMVDGQFSTDFDVSGNSVRSAGEEAPLASSLPSASATSASPVSSLPPLSSTAGMLVSVYVAAGVCFDASANGNLESNLLEVIRIIS